MITNEERIAELAGLLPMFIGALLEGSEVKPSVKLNISEERTLMYLLKDEGNPMTEYSKKVGLTKGSFTTVADRLETKGFIKRISVCEDRRKNALILTKEGKSIAKEIDAYFKQHISNKVAQLEEEDINNLKNALETMVVIMGKLKERKE
ncbi:DNA-binding transcriptional regulator, MarR family [Anaerovirgula multivorans]|uniref:DNA-binding transcriptional regulator, MarR family n=1 Tax=Anaerovirgula multivorans TaxID=312168 RepID=A0A239IHU1_9FIRM|nr:MarR family transcriptional regulator [Anaerovirgula multivorans]SNS93177.1 DNA-binding transcriptional regulator, MarR family [Anaerovirgula multivorans]